MRGAHLDGASLIEVLKPVVLGQDPLDRERLYHALWQRSRATTARAIGAVDVALWDLAGKVAGLPIHRLLGSYRDRVRAYASSAVLALPGGLRGGGGALQGRGLDRLQDPSADRSGHGHRGLPGGAPGGRRRLHGDARLDAGPTTTRRRSASGQAIEALGFHWYEDPLADDDLYSYVKLKQQLRIPILATEYSPGGFTAYAPWLLARATDFLRGDVAVKGGITALVKAAHLAEAFHMNFEVHHGGNSLNNVANLHVIMAIRNCEFFEVLLPAGAQKYGLVEDIEVDRHGLGPRAERPRARAPRIDFDLIERRQDRRPALTAGSTTAATGGATARRRGGATTAGRARRRPPRGW